MERSLENRYSNFIVKRSFCDAERLDGLSIIWVVSGRPMRSQYPGHVITRDQSEVASAPDC